MKDATGAMQSALVLGGSSEIGEAIVRRLAARRLRRVVLAGRTPERLEETAQRLRAAGVATVATTAWDATDAGGHRAALDAVWAEHGDLDVVIAAAGVLGDEGRTQHDGAAAADVLAANFTGLAAALVEVRERLVRQGHGTIVVLSSVAGERARRSNFVYGASKAGLDAFAQGLGDAAHGDGIGVLVVRPGFVHSRMTEGLAPAPLATTPDAVAERVVLGLRRGATTVWAPGALRWVMLVLRLLPRPLFRLLPV